MNYLLSEAVSEPPLPPWAQMTVSFHKYGDYFFPGTGDVKDMGIKGGEPWGMGANVAHPGEDA